MVVFNVMCFMIVIIGVLGVLFWSDKYLKDVVDCNYNCKKDIL